MKKIIALLLLFVCVFGLAAYFGMNMTFAIGEASKVSIKSGLTGDEVNLTDTEVIRSVTHDINSLRFEKTSAYDDRVAYIYVLKWFDAEDNQIAEITITEEGGHQISHDGYFYKVAADQSIDTALIEELLNGGQ